MNTTNHISFEELADNMTDVFNKVREEHTPIVVEYATGEQVVIKPLRTALKTDRRHRKRTNADHESFLAAAGGWSDVDTDELKKRIYESRAISTRPPVDL